ncbi:MAG TPA: hypothetical protein VNX26_00565 [Candidatus Acidoferrum sp.]|nr:hypothetical protein [Candidatus Acidoferrum sp.]
MEAITRLVADSLARHGFDRPVDPRRLQWSRWFRCDSPHSLLVVPSKPGIFALAEDVMDLGPGNTLGSCNDKVGTAAPGSPAEQSSAVASSATTLAGSTDREGHDFRSEPALSKRSAPKGAVSAVQASAGLVAEVPLRRMLAVLQFSEDDDMAFTLDRMFTRINPMRARLSSGRCFLRFVVIEDQAQRRNICTALNQWMLTSAEKATGLPADFQSSLELAPTSDCLGAGDSPALESATARVGRTLLSANADTAQISPTAASLAPESGFPAAPPHIDSGAAKNLHCPHPLPSGF